MSLVGFYPSRIYVLFEYLFYISLRLFGGSDLLELKDLPLLNQRATATNRIVDINILFPELENILSCQKCYCKIKFSASETCGLAFEISVSCSNCKRVALINSSKLVDLTSGTYEVDRRSVLAAHTIQQVHTGLSTFCDIMDFPKPIDQSNFDLIYEEVYKLPKVILDDSTIVVVKKEVDETPSSDAELDASMLASVKEGLDETLPDNTYLDNFTYVTVKEEFDVTPSNETEIV